MTELNDEEIVFDVGNFGETGGPNLKNWEELSMRSDGEPAVACN